MPKFRPFFMKPPFLGLICFGKMFDEYEVQLWTLYTEDIFSDPYAYNSFK